MKRCRRVVLALLVVLAALPGLGDDTDILVLGTVEPNVMILLDSSGSMNTVITGGTKISIAKAVVTDLVQNTANVRFGVMKFKSHGAEMVAPIGTDVPTMVAAVDAMTTTSVGTPLGDALKDVGEYFKGNLPGYPSPIDLSCRLNMIIVVSDGLQNTSNLDIADEALLRYTQDHGSGVSGTQIVIVHTIGFAIPPGDAAAANDKLQDTADNGGGDFFSTTNAAELKASLEEAINALIAGAYGFSGVTVPSTSVTGSDKLYQASVITNPVRPFWRGFLRAYQREADGSVPTDSDGIPLSSSLVWEAGQQLSAKSASSRTIETVIGGTLQNFDKANGLLTQALLNVASAGARDDVIDFIRGVDSIDEDGDGDTTDQREWKLGDILHSTPVLVTRPILISVEVAYQAFKLSQVNRVPVLLVGANDGMLHAFRESDGEELWAFVPPDLLGSLRNLTASSGVHPYYVDASPVAADVKIAGTYRTVVLFGERRGGGSYHALDVTDTTNPTYLWSFTDAKIAESWSVPAIAPIKLADGTRRWVAFFGGGYDTAQNNNSGKAFFAVDMETGAKLWEYANDGTADDRQYMNFSIAAPPTVLDLDLDGNIDRVYIGDVGGQMWKFDLSAPAVLSAGVVTNWSGKRLFNAVPGQANPPAVGAWEPGQAIYGAPAAAVDAFGDLWLYFGTGDLNHPIKPSTNRFYGLRETTDMANGSEVTEASLANVTSTDATAPGGWYFQLLSTEKVLVSADVFNGIVFFTSFTPAVAITCDGAGTATLYAVQMTTGYAALDWPGGEVLEETDSSEPRSTVVGTGIPAKPAIVATVVDGILETSVVTATTELEVDDQGVDPVALRRVLFWREAY